VAQSMKVLPVGGGGREHALAWRLREEDPSIDIVAAPGNPGIGQLATCAPIPVSGINRLAEFAETNRFDWTLVGPEAPLGDGIVDAFRAHGLPIFGPTRAGAMLETSKAFSKTLMASAAVPTARAVACDGIAAAHAAIDSIGAPLVIKASGLAAGKGVIICKTVAEARSAASAMLGARVFGAAGDVVLVEEFMECEELSIFAITDGEEFVILPSAQDHKRLHEGDEGPNTGGMGAYSPVSLTEQSPALISTIAERIIGPTLAEMRRRQTAFTGLLYVGAMVTANGPKVVEFNCRFGDPETQAVLPVISREESLIDLMSTVARGGSLRESRELSATSSAVTTVLAAPGYPDAPATGSTILIPDAPAGVLVFHAGTKRDDSGHLVTAGGRVLGVTGVASSFDEAQARSQAFARDIQFDGKQFRADIGWRELNRRAGATGD
jgi:phosphoribosylamine--glycine ligase